MTLLRQILDTTYPKTSNPELLGIWLFGILLGELFAFTITTWGIHIFSKKKIGLREASLISALATTASFLFGILYWMATGFW